MGKLSSEELKRLLKCIEKQPKIIVPPALGYDSGVHLINKNECLVVSTDPCIGVPEEWFGWLLIHYAASDVALFGAKPRFCAITLLGPPETEAKVFIEIMKQVCAAAAELDVIVVTGHTGTYDQISTLVGACTAYGVVSKDKLITPSGCQIGDRVICTKQIGLETVVNLVLTHRTLAENLFNSVRTRELQNLIYMQTCVKDALLLASIGGVHAMHDATEGGLVAALNEMADSSNLGFIVDLERLPIQGEAQTLKDCFNLSQSELLSMSSTGTLLAAVDPTNEDHALQELRRHGIEASVIGSFTRNKTRQIQHKGKAIAFPKVAEDPYARILKRNAPH